MSVASRALAVLAAVACAAGRSAAAQEGNGLELSRSLYPLVYWQSSSGWTLRGVLRYSAPAPPDRPEINAVDVGISAFIGTEDYRGVDIAMYAPALVDGWRFLIIGRIIRESRFGFYGLGNDTPRDPDLVTDTSEHYYQLRRVSALGRADIHRRIVGRLRAFAGLAYRKSDFSALPGTTLFGDQIVAGAIDSTDLEGLAFAARFGLVVDTRDKEFDPRRGFLGEVIVEGDGDFNRVTARALGVVSPARRLRLAARAAGERMDGDWPLSEAFWMETSWTAFSALGGYYTHRGLRNNRFVGPGKLILSTEVRYDFIRIPTLFELVGVAFVDGGRVFDHAEWDVTLKDIHWGGGVGVAAKVYTSTLFGVTFGVSADGITGDLGFGWSY